VTDNPKAFQRRKPKQARSQATYDSILEAAEQMLERDGADGLNTNRIAERAGVSIGTLYQYFPDKAAILLATAQRSLAQPEGGFVARPKALIAALVRTLEELMGGSAAARAGGRRRTGGPVPPLRPMRDSEPLEQRLLAWLIPIGLTPIPVVARRRGPPIRR
jgi:AcrR family transcriptional regulator